MIELLSAIATVLAIIGVIANNNRARFCFLLWMVSNTLTAAIHAHAGLYSLCVRDVVFLVLAVHGWIMWGKK